MGAAVAEVAKQAAIAKNAALDIPQSPRTMASSSKADLTSRSADNRSQTNGRSMSFNNRTIDSIILNIISNGYKTETIHFTAIRRTSVG